MMRNRLFGYLFILIVAVVAASCRRIELYEPHSGVYVKFNIQVEPDIVSMYDKSYPFPDIVRGGMPSSFRVCFYDPVSHSLVAEDLLGYEGGFVNIAAGTYDIMAYSLGTEVTRVAGSDSRAACYAYSSATGYSLNLTRADSNDHIERYNFSVIHEPDHIYVGRKADVEIPVVPDDNRIIVINLDESTLLESYTFQALNIIGAERVESVTCYVTGQASQRYLWDSRYSNNQCAIGFAGSLDVENGTIITAFNTFGRFPGSSSRVFVNLLVNDKSGGKYQWIFDVTEQFDNPDNEKHEISIVSAIVIPERQQGGFTPSVGDWNAEIIDVPLS